MDKKFNVLDHYKGFFDSLYCNYCNKYFSVSADIDKLKNHLESKHGEKLI